jgi:hypothetical protein
MADFWGDKILGTADNKKTGIGMRSRKRSRGQNWLMGELGEKKEKSFVRVSWNQISHRPRGRGCVIKRLGNMNGRGYKKATWEHRGEGEWVTWEQEKESKKVMSVIQILRCSIICSSCGDLVKGESQCTDLAIVHAYGVPKQMPLGLERNGGQIGETAETEEELYKKTRSGEEVRISMDPLRGVCKWS